jgi:plastocyanin
MRLNTVLTAIGLVALAQAAPHIEKRGTYETGVDVYMPAAATTSAATMMTSGTNYDVSVGGSAGLVYSPEYIMANVGDTVTFHFGTKNHTLTQSTFAVPCGAMSGGTCSLAQS